MQQTPQDKIRPPLKWTGGKYQILDRIKKRLPEAERLIEPFSGSNAVFLNTTFKYYTLNDSNPDLVNFYKFLKKDSNAFIEHCRQYFSSRYNKAEAYYKFRVKFNHSKYPLLRAVLFLYLNRHGYNGMCRYNASGYLNVPFGRYKKSISQKKNCCTLLKKAGVRPSSARILPGSLAKPKRQMWFIAIHPMSRLAAPQTLPTTGQWI